MKNRLGNASQWWVGAVCRAPWAVVLAMFLLVVVALNYTINNLKFNTDTVTLLAEDLPFRQTYDQYKRAFPQNVDSLIVVIEGATPELTLAATRQLNTSLQAIDPPFESIYAPGISDFFQQNGLLYQDIDALQKRADELAGAQPFLARLTLDPSLRGLLSMLGSGLELVAAGDFVDLEPILEPLSEAVEASLRGDDFQLSWQQLISGQAADINATRQYIMVQPQLDFGQLLPARQAIEAIRHLAHELEQEATQELSIRITGNRALNYEEMQSVSQGMGTAVVLALIMVLVILWVALRSLSLVLVTLLTLLAGLSLTAGFATLAVGELNLISIAFAVLYIGLGVDFAIHLCLRYQELVHDGATARNALLSAAGDVGSSLVLCAVTTATAFYAFIPTDYSGVSALGLIAGTGMFISLFVSLTLLPALLSILPLPAAIPRQQTVPGRFLIAMAQLPYRNGQAVIRGALVVGALSALTLPFAEFDFNPLHLRDARSESVSTFRDLLATSATPPWSLTVLSPDANAAEATKKQLQALDTVSKVMSLQDFIPDDQESKFAVIDDMVTILGSDILDPAYTNPAAKPPPDNQQQLAALENFAAAMSTYQSSTIHVPWLDEVGRLLSAVQQLRAQLASVDVQASERQLARLEHGLFGYLPTNLQSLRASLMADEVTQENLPRDLVQRWLSDQGVYRIAAYPRENVDDNLAMRRFVAEVRSVSPQATDAPVFYVESANVVVRAFQTAFALAFVVIGLLLIVIMRSVADASFVLLPLLLGGLLTTAVLLASGNTFNYANIITLPLLLGIGVDNGIHMIQRARSEPGGKINLLQTSTARAVFFSALTTIASFGNLAYSPHPGTASMGQVLTIGVLCAMVATLIVLPALVNRFSKARDVAAA